MLEPLGGMLAGLIYPLLIFNSTGERRHDLRALGDALGTFWPHLLGGPSRGIGLGLLKIVLGLP
jgi:hypothetical protein